MNALSRSVGLSQSRWWFGVSLLLPNPLVGFSAASPSLTPAGKSCQGAPGWVRNGAPGWVRNGAPGWVRNAPRGWGDLFLPSLCLTPVGSVGPGGARAGKRRPTAPVTQGPVPFVGWFGFFFFARLPLARARGVFGSARGGGLPGSSRWVKRGARFTEALPFPCPRSAVWHWGRCKGARCERVGGSARRWTPAGCCCTVQRRHQNWYFHGFNNEDVLLGLFFLRPSSPPPVLHQVATYLQRLK